MKQVKVSFFFKTYSKDKIRQDVSTEEAVKKEKKKPLKKRKRKRRKFFVFNVMPYSG